MLKLNTNYLIVILTSYHNCYAILVIIIIIIFFLSDFDSNILETAKVTILKLHSKIDLSERFHVTRLLWR